MPVLMWPSKSQPYPIRCELNPDSLVFPNGNGYHSPTNGLKDWDKLILGDNFSILYSLMDKYEGEIDLIYTDPPFYSNRIYPSRIGKGEDSRKPRDWKLGKGYTDHWKNLDEYLDMLYPRLVLMHRLLSSTGTFYLHLDWHANSYARILLDEIFGAENLLNEIIWTYHGPSPIKSAFNRKHDTILVYTKSRKYTFNVDEVREPYNPQTVKTFASSTKAGFGKIPDLKRGKVPEDWWYFPVVARLHNERTGYPTQKPEALLERIIKASSNPGDLVADFFCGAGTTPVVASKLNRRFIASDISWQAVHTSRSRLVNTVEDPFLFLMSSDAKQTRIYSPSSAESPSISENQVIIPSELLQKLEYWEIDLEPEREYFFSYKQAIRPRRKGEISQSIELPCSTNISNIRLRYVTIDGARGDMVLQISENAA